MNSVEGKILNWIRSKIVFGSFEFEIKRSRNLPGSIYRIFLNSTSELPISNSIHILTITCTLNRVHAKVVWATCHVDHFKFEMPCASKCVLWKTLKLGGRICNLRKKKCPSFHGTSEEFWQVPFFVSSAIRLYLYLLLSFDD